MRVEGTHYFKEDYFIDRLRHAGRTPVQIDRLTDQIAEFQRDPRIERVHSKLQAGNQIGESRLLLIVTEASQVDAQLSVSNERPASVRSSGRLTREARRKSSIPLFGYSTSMPTPNLSESNCIRH